MVPGSAFGPSGEGHVRMCYATAYEQLEEALARIGRFVGAPPGLTAIAVTRGRISSGITRADSGITYPRGMATADSHGLGYQRVDDDPNVDVLLATMDGTAGWDATLRLRSWERAQLGLADGERLLDVGCGLGEAALALAQDLGEGGEVVGIDASEQHAARRPFQRPEPRVVACASPSAMRAPSTSPTIPSTPRGPNARSSGSPTPQPRSPRWCGWCAPAAASR